MISFTVQGGDALENSLKSLGPAGPRVLRAAIKKESEKLVMALKNNAPVNSGTLRASFGLDIKNQAKFGYITSKVGVLRSYQATASTRVSGRPGENEQMMMRRHYPILYVKKINKATHWMEKTWESVSQSSMTSILDNAWDSIKKAIKRQARKAARGR